MKNGAENESLLQRYEHDENSSRYFVKQDDRYSMPELDERPPLKPVRKWPTIFSVLFMVFGWFMNELALAWIHDRVPTDYPPLPDLWFSFFPEVQGAIRVTEYIMFILSVNAIVVMLTHQHRWIVIRRTLFCVSLAYCFRALCVTIFQVPVPSVHTYCAPQANSSASLVATRVSRMFWSAGIEQLRPRELCGDLIVSGHTLTLFTAFLVLKTYAPKKLQALTFIYQGLAFTAIIAILLARKHYLIDVVLGYTVSTRIFMEYHSLAVSYHESSLDNNPLSWSWWTIFIPFLERDAPPPSQFHNHLSLSRSSSYVSKKPLRSSE